MVRTTYSKKGGRVRSSSTRDRTGSRKSTEEVVRDIKKGMQKPPGEDYRERSLAIHGLICARCAREFDETSRHLLTVHHKDGNHQNNPPDGSNWENLCVYCHEDAHSRGILGDYLGGASTEKEQVRIYGEEREPSEKSSGLGSLGEKIAKAMKEKNRA